MSENISVELLTVAELIDGYTAPASAFSVSLAEHRATVPAGKRWWLIGGSITRDVSATLNVRVYNASNETIWWIATEAAATGENIFPEENMAPSGVLIPMDAGWYVKIIFGVNQGAGAALSCCVLEVDV